MRLPFRIAIFLLTALWVPAAAHCELRSAGLFGYTAEGSACTGCADGACLHDGCHETESSVIRHDTTIQASAPLWVPSQWDVLVSLLKRPVEDRPMTFSPAARELPLRWVPTWSFTRRAALNPRAPSNVSA